MATPHAPWSLVGECMVALVPGAGSLPQGLARLPGPSVVVGVSYTASPVGPYVELAVAQPAHLGARPGLCFTTVVVNCPDSRVAGRVNWGLPKELGRLSWTADGDQRELRWHDRDITLRGRPIGPPLPMLVPVRALQRRGDGPVTVPFRIRGKVRLGRVEVSVPDGDPLARLAGRRPGALVSSMRFVIEPARMPIGLRATLRAPLTAPEPALLLAGDGRGD